MKRTLVAFVILAVAVTGVFASGVGGKGAGTDPLCGTWYGGSTNPDHAGFKYQYTFIPTGSDRWYVMAQGIYNPDSLGAAVLSRFTGEVVHLDGDYEIRLIAMATTDPVDPPDELPVIHAVRGGLTVNSENEVTVEYDLYGIYAWDTTPFVDEPAVWGIPPNSTVLTEIIHRMRMDVALP
jgi:hypothetical protein